MIHARRAGSGRIGSYPSAGVQDRRPLGRALVSRGPWPLWRGGARGVWCAVAGGRREMA